MGLIFFLWGNQVKNLKQAEHFKENLWKKSLELKYE